MLGPHARNRGLAGGVVSQEERYGTRDGTYSAWHRRGSTRRYVGIEKAQLLAMIDVDACLWLEWDDGQKAGVGLIEVARDVGQAIKPTTILEWLANRAQIPAFVCLYTPSETPNPADPEWPDIKHFRVRSLWPAKQEHWRVMSPAEWAQKLLSMRAWQAANYDGDAA